MDDFGAPMGTSEGGGHDLCRSRQPPLRRMSARKLFFNMCLVWQHQNISNCFKCYSASE